MAKTSYSNERINTSSFLLNKKKQNDCSTYFHTFWNSLRLGHTANLILERFCSSCGESIFFNLDLFRPVLRGVCDYGMCYLTLMCSLIMYKRLKLISFLFFLTNCIILFDCIISYRTLSESNYTSDRRSNRFNGYIATQC